MSPTHSEYKRSAEVQEALRERSTDSGPVLTKITKTFFVMFREGIDAKSLFTKHSSDFFFRLLTKISFVTKIICIFFDYNFLNFPHIGHKRENKQKYFLLEFRCLPENLKFNPKSQKLDFVPRQSFTQDKKIPWFLILYVAGMYRTSPPLG